MDEREHLSSASKSWRVPLKALGDPIIIDASKSKSLATKSDSLSGGPTKTLPNLPRDLLIILAVWLVAFAIAWITAYAKEVLR